jgi:K+-sensing histidine kinase KdpD
MSLGHAVRQPGGRRIAWVRPMGQPVATKWGGLAKRVLRTAGVSKATVANLCGLTAPLVIAALLVPARTTLVGTAAALILVALIAAIAILGTRVAGLIASASSALWFDFFLTKPYERLTISHRADLETAISLFVVGLIVTELAARSRHHRQAAVEEADFVAVIHKLGEMISLGEPAAQVVDTASAELTQLLGLRGCSYVAGAPKPHRTTVLLDGQVVHGGLLWGVSTMGLPGRDLDLPVQYGGRTVGRFVMVPTPGHPVPLERMIVAVAIASQAGASLASRARIA